ncbi:MAG: type IV secretory system conjugative DNA transfer family protein, partial [Proteobacteria bacterium]|nr:type IV secretory system conjugative DNA transfer family protein [Pseudomonadota bacterium]
EYPETDHNLPTIYDIILTGSPEGTISMPEAFNVLVDRMAMNNAMGRAPMDAAKVLKEAGENERGGFITTLATGLSWVNTPVLRPILMKSSFKLRDIKLKRETVYLVVPFEHMKNHSRFLRTVVSLGLMACREHAEHDYKTLYLLDEFPQLGTFRPIKEGLVTLRSRDVKIWMHLQNLGQLKERYGNWQNFMSSCDKQFFAVNDHGSAEEISKMLGDYVERWVEGKKGETKSVDKNRPLRSPSEVMDELKKGSGLQYVLPSDGLPLRLKLVSFKKNFNKYGTVKGNKFG